jgi:hypothetical protein
MRWQIRLSQRYLLMSNCFALAFAAFMLALQVDMYFWKAIFFAFIVYVGILGLVDHFTTLLVRPDTQDSSQAATQ